MRRLCPPRRQPLLMPHLPRCVLAKLLLVRQMHQAAPARTPWEGARRAALATFAARTAPVNLLCVCCHLATSTSYRHDMCPAALVCTASFLQTPRPGCSCADASQAPILLLQASPTLPTATVADPVAASAVAVPAAATAAQQQHEQEARLAEPAAHEHHEAAEQAAPASGATASAAETKELHTDR